MAGVLSAITGSHGLTVLGKFQFRAVGEFNLIAATFA